MGEEGSESGNGNEKTGRVVSFGNQTPEEIAALRIKRIASLLRTIPGAEERPDLIAEIRGFWIPFSSPRYSIHELEDLLLDMPHNWKDKPAKWIAAAKALGGKYALQQMKRD